MVSEIDRLGWVGKGGKGKEGEGPLVDWEEWCILLFSLPFAGPFLRYRLSANSLFARWRPRRFWLILKRYCAESLDNHLRVLEDGSLRISLVGLCGGVNSSKPLP